MHQKLLCLFIAGLTLVVGRRERAKPQTSLTDPYGAVSKIKQSVVYLTQTSCTFFKAKIPFFFFLQLLAFFDLEVCPYSCCSGVLGNGQ